jgi:hypothetical protein
MGTANQKYKASVFSALFSEETKLIELYNAIAGSSYKTGEVQITINTLDDALFLGRIIDISFTIDNKLVILLEHQSSLNKNMPLRLLIYIARIYEKLVDNKDIYKQMLLKIPTPEFIVLYNGVDDFPDEQILHLADAFNYQPEDGRAPQLDLAVRVLNINPDHNQGILQKSANLKGYADFIAKVREYKTAGDELAAAITKAIKYCTSNDILVTFLLNHGSEVLNMLTMEFNLDDALQVAREEGKIEGEARGEARGKIEDAKNMLLDGQPAQKISKWTGLPLERVIAIQKELMQKA